MYYLIDQSIGPANACFTVASADGKLRLVRLGTLVAIPGRFSCVVVLDQSAVGGYGINLTLTDGGAVGAMPTRQVPVPDSLVQLTGLRSGSADPEQCTRAADQLFADSVSAARSR
jgi:hypothetical protein